MGFQKNQSIVSIFGKYQVVQFNNNPLVITLFADQDAPTGLFSIRFYIFFLISKKIILGLLMDLGSELLELTNPIVATYNQQNQH